MTQDKCPHCGADLTEWAQEQRKDGVDLAFNMAVFEEEAQEWTFHGWAAHAFVYARLAKATFDEARAIAQSIDLWEEPWMSYKYFLVVSAKSPHSVTLKDRTTGQARECSDVPTKDIPKALWAAFTMLIESPHVDSPKHR